MLKPLLRTFLLFVFGLAFTSVQGQELAFDTAKHDFGRFPPTTKQLSHDFTFTNKGADPLKLKKVETSCGCTTPEWPKAAIQPGEQGRIKVIYDATTSEGYFRKSVTVLTAHGTTHSLMIEGEQKSQRESSTPQGYRVKRGQLAFKKGIADFGHLRYGSTDTTYITAYNNSSNNMLIKKLRGPGFLKAPGLPRTLRPEQSARLMVIYTAIKGLKANPYGTANGEGVLLTNDEAKPYKAFQYQAKVYPDVSQPAKQSGKPQAELAHHVLDFGSVSPYNSINTGVRLTNTGDAPLEIKGTDSKGCGCEAPVPGKNRLDPGEQTIVRVKFNASSYSGRVERDLEIYTNDPDQPYTILKLKAYVE